MNISEIQTWHKRINDLLDQGRLLDAFEGISGAFPQKSYTAFSTRLEELRFTYNNMLNYTMKGVDDPQRDEIHNRLILGTYELSDDLKLELLNAPGFRLASLKGELEKQLRRSNEDLAESLMSLSFDHELNEMLHGSAFYEDESESDSAIKHRQAIQRVFNFLWLTNRFSENDAVVVAKIFNSNSFPWYEKALLVSAVTLGLVRTFDPQRIEILIKLYAHNNPQISQRALVGILMAISLYDKRVGISPQLNSVVKLLMDDESFESDSFSVITQIIRSKDTDKIARKFREHIVPDILKFNEDLSRKLNLENLLETGEEPDKNPNWEKYFDNQPDLVRKLEELTNMQMEGADVFLGAFSMLKNFSFFNDAHHWFMPFYKKNFAVANALRNESEDFREILLKGVENSPYMCNSDKFSFILNLSHMPLQQKELMSSMFSSEIEQFEELMNEELTDPALRKKRIVIQYIQDLYRFFKLNPVKTETGDIFLQPLDVHNTAVMGDLISSADFYRNIAGFYFDNDHFGEALLIYHRLIYKEETSAELFEKAGYCLQQTGKFREAIEMYRKADLFDTNRKWLLGKMAQCHLKLSQSKEALEVYLELLQLDPESRKVLASIGTCYLNMGEYNQALEYFYRIEFSEPGSAGSMRPVAWCLFVLNRPGEADAYYAQLLDMEPNEYDYMNAGHVAWCLSDRQKAAELYLKSIEKRDGDLKAFLVAFNTDKVFLLQNSLDPLEIRLMIDYLRIRYQENSAQA
ncbi:MAG: tetratricopeptide repeat protein [Bacteroidales bacterium]|nr:tetratricopeptide repeat protein [Bacteroidales bacterium]